MHQDTAERALLRLLSVRMEAILAALKQQQWLPPAPLSLPTQGGGSPYVADLLQLLQVGRPLGMPVCAYACGGGCPCVIDLLQLLQEGGPLGMPVCVWGGGQPVCGGHATAAAGVGHGRVCVRGAARGTHHYCHPCAAATHVLLPPLCYFHPCAAAWYCHPWGTCVLQAVSHALQCVMCGD